MPEHSLGTTTCWLHGVRTGDAVAAQELWNKYFASLARFAHGKLRQISRDRDGEDIALSAMKSVLIGIQDQRFPDLTDSTGLWPLLITVTARKVANEQRRNLTKKRSVGAERSLEDWRTIIGETPTPEFSLEVTDELDRLIGVLEDESIKIIALRKLEGFTNDEIASELGVSTRTVIRKLNLIRREWEESD